MSSPQVPILDQILQRTRQTVALAKSRTPVTALEALLPSAPPPRSLYQALGRGGMACIAEIKRRSPSAGWIHQGADAAEVARSYQRGGAAALSVLTDEPFFGGSLDDLRRVRQVVDLPLLRKDFIFDAYQLLEARVAGADAALLIVAALTDAELSALLAEADRLQLDILMETHDAQEIQRAVAVGARIIGVNHRDLRTFQMDMTLAVRMRPLVPPHLYLVAESGLRARADVERMQAGGINAILVGEGLMRASDPGAALQTLLGVP